MANAPKQLQINTTYKDESRHRVKTEADITKEMTGYSALM
jgi:hypothetical protein